MGAISKIASDITTANGAYSQERLEATLAKLYDARTSAAMVVDRYPHTPFVKDYSVTIAEAVEAHFFGLDHIAVAGLIPVVEGAAKRLAAAWGVSATTTTNLFQRLAKAVKKDVIAKNTGAVGEILSMISSFENFATKSLYVGTQSYKIGDGTNRHGISHGTYGDAEYGRPINFYKIIAAVNFLVFISSLKSGISLFSADHSNASLELAVHYLTLKATRAHRTEYGLPGAVGQAGNQHEG